MKTVILTPLAERDVLFYLATAHELKKDPQTQVVFISFFQPGNELIRQQGFAVYDPYLIPFPPLSAAQAAQRFDTPPLEPLTLHERLTFGIDDLDAALKKFSDRLQACDGLLDQIEKEYPADCKTAKEDKSPFFGPPMYSSGG